MTSIPIYNFELSFDIYSVESAEFDTIRNIVEASADYILCNVHTEFDKYNGQFRPITSFSSQVISLLCARKIVVSFYGLFDL